MRLTTRTGGPVTVRRRMARAAVILAAAGIATAVVPDVVHMGSGQVSSQPQNSNSAAVPSRVVRFSAHR